MAEGWTVVALLALIAGRVLAVPVENEWWGNTVIYEIWPRAFQDSDGDGNGDLQGISERLDYLEDLGVETISLNPIYPSPMIAAGYDISNYTDIHPIFGDMSDFDQLIDEIHERGMKLILDLVPNHSSDEHTWFYGSINRIEPYTDYYIWSDGEIDANGTRYPPNEWIDVLDYDGGSAWTWNDVRGQWYYHKYHESQPDLNLRNEDVIQEILDIITFWLERGVDGFTISDVNYFFEEPSQDELSQEESTFETPETANLLYQIREYTDNWSEANNSTRKLLIAEAWSPDENLLSYYGNDERSGVIPLNFRLIGSIDGDVNAGDMKFLIDGWLKMLPDNATTNWPLSNDKHPRIATRVGENKFPTYLILSMLLPGQAYTYYGDEIGMTDSKLPWNATQSSIPPLLTPNTLLEYSRNAPRTPMQWNEDTSGFSTNHTYLPVNENNDHTNVEKQLEEPGSTLNTYKSLTKLRKDPVFQLGDWEVETLNDDRILVIRRDISGSIGCSDLGLVSNGKFLEGHPEYVVLINTGDEKESANVSSLYPDLQDHMEVVLSSGDPLNQTTVHRDDVELASNSAMVLKNSLQNKTSEELFFNDSSEHSDCMDSYDGETVPDIGEASGGDILEGYLSSEKEGEDLTFNFNNSAESDVKATTTLRPIHYTTEEIRIPTQAPRSMNNAMNGDAVEGSGCKCNEMVKLVLALCLTILLIFNKT